MGIASTALLGVMLAGMQAGVLAAQDAAERAAAWPDPLVGLDGSHVTSAKEFEATRRGEIMRLYEENQFGKTPTGNVAMKATVTSEDQHALNGLAVRKQVTLTFTGNGMTRAVHVLEYLPARASGPVPVFVGLNFDGNWTVSGDPGIDLTDEWVPDPEEDHVPVAKEMKVHFRRHATEAARGKNASRWQVETIVRAGFGLVTAYGGDIEPDFATGIGYGVRPLLFEKGQYIPAADEWGTIGAWAWGLSRIVDYLETDPAVNGKEIIGFGHSRFGKTMLWAGAQDKRFAMVISNESGKGGASLSHRGVEESIAHLNISFPHWFCANYHH
ncbi:MAG TPA: hypothetical protein VLT57_16510, partial [Bryobacteraceae bacterium]|nr:hypothetical protein [Bryobacteraceae bacterium]